MMFDGEVREISPTTGIAAALNDTNKANALSRPWSRMCGEYTHRNAIKHAKTRCQYRRLQPKRVGNHRCAATYFAGVGRFGMGRPRDTAMVRRSNRTLEFDFERGKPVPVWHRGRETLLPNRRAVAADFWLYKNRRNLPSGSVTPAAPFPGLGAEPVPPSARPSTL